MVPEYDYIIIGAGTAGCVLANRLSADPGNSVLLLEAGGRDRSPNIKIPAAFNKLFKTDLDHGYHTTTQSNMAGRKMYLPRGKVLGGSSSINAMVYIRGNRADFDSWSALGNKGWSYDEVLPYFKRSEDQQVHNDEYHGTGGPQVISDRNYTNPLSAAFVQAALELGYDPNSDFNGERQEGFGMYQVYHRNGQRQSSAHAYLHPVRNRSNLTVETRAAVDRVEIKNGRTVEVEYKLKGQPMEALVRKEVLVCAGAYNSPQLLMLSGIGNGDELQRHGIPVHSHLPGVGKHLQDHLLVPTIFHSTFRHSLDSAEDFPGVIGNLLNYMAYRRGPFASNIAEAGGFVRSSPELEAVDIQFHFAPCYFVRHGFDNPKRGNGYSIGSKVLTPASQGTVRLASPEPELPPAIDHNYLADPEDVRRAVIGYRLAQRIGLTEAFRPFRAELFQPERPLEDDQAIEDHIRAHGETLYHPTSTCRMGRDEMSVVDDNLRVRGIQGLRVVDASVMPHIIRGNTNAAVLMIAEKAADLILAVQDPF